MSTWTAYRGVPGLFALHMEISMWLTRSFSIALHLSCATRITREVDLVSLRPWLRPVSRRVIRGIGHVDDAPVYWSRVAYSGDVDGGLLGREAGGNRQSGKKVSLGIGWTLSCKARKVTIQILPPGLTLIGL